MFRTKRKLVFGVALVVALSMLFILSSVAFAGTNQPTKTTASTVCVDGYVINNQEVPVDGTKTDPALYVAAIGSTGSYSATVASSGYFKFESLPVSSDPNTPNAVAQGDWNFQMQLPQDWEGIAPAADNAGLAETGVTTLKEQDACYRIVFKVRRVFGVMVVKWEELLDGTVQPGANWTITAAPVDDPYVKPQTGTTDAGGRVGFTLTAGKWNIYETLKSGWVAITPSQVTLKLGQYTAAGAMDPVVFKNREPVCKSEIDVQKVGYGTDVNGKQVMLGPLAGWSVTVSRADGTMTPITKVTDGVGKAVFKHLMPGVYNVQETVLAGWEAMSDNPQTVVHRDCETTLVRFENKELNGDLSISGRKLFEAWKAPYAGTVVGLPGWVITATLVGKNDVVTTTVTDALGNYVFPEAQLATVGMAFPGASIEVCEEARDNWIAVTPSCVTVKFPYPVPPDYAGATVDFTNQEDPPAPTAHAATRPAAGCQASVVVSRGQTLARIARQYGTSVSALVRANHIPNADLVYAGQRLCVR